MQCFRNLSLGIVFISLDKATLNFQVDQCFTFFKNCNVNLWILTLHPEIFNKSIYTLTQTMNVICDMADLCPPVLAGIRNMSKREIRFDKTLELIVTNSPTHSRLVFGYLLLQVCALCCYLRIHCRKLPLSYQDYINIFI